MGTRMNETNVGIDKFCVNCKWHRISEVPRSDPGELDRCMSPHVGVNPVTGLTAKAFCSVQRLNRVNGACGPEGDHFEAKEIALESAQVSREI